MIPDIAGFTDKTENFSADCLRGVLFDAIAQDDTALIFHLPDGVSLAGDSRTTGEAVLKVFTSPEKVRVLISKQIRAMKKQVRYCVRRVEAGDLFALACCDSILFTELFGQERGSILWRGAIRDRDGNATLTTEIKVDSDIPLRRVLYYNAETQKENV